MLSRPGALPDFNFLMAASSSSTVKSDDSMALAVAALESEVTSSDDQRAKSLSASGKRPLFRSCEAVAFAVTGQIECVVLLPVSLFIVCHALRLEYVKSTNSTTSAHLALHTSSSLWSSAVVCVSMSSLVVLAKKVVAAVIPFGDVVFVEAARDVLLRCSSKHVAIRRVDVYVTPASSASTCGRPVVLLSVSAVNNSQLAYGTYIS